MVNERILHAKGSPDASLTLSASSVLHAFRKDSQIDFCRLSYHYYQSVKILSIYQGPSKAAFSVKLSLNFQLEVIIPFPTFSWCP